MKLLLIYPPFCTPTILPYALASLHHFFQTHLEIEIDIIDLNAEFHKRKFAKYYHEIQNTKTKEEYARICEEFDKESREVYAKNNRAVMQGEKPEFFAEMLSLIEEKDYDLYACSLVYNSQCFYATALLSELKKKGRECIMGGPAAKGKILDLGIYLENEEQMLSFFTKKGIKKKQGKNTAENVLDFSSFPEQNYLSKERIIPLKTSTTCFYKQCTFCTHFAPVPYKEYEMPWLENTLKKNKVKYTFLIDDMLTKERLIAFAKICKKQKIQWACQLRPTPDILGISKELYDGGLRSVSWGVESASQRILNLMKKGTELKKIPHILKESHEAGIQNIVYIMFAFPTETRKEYEQTITFLEENSQNIDLICTSIFGLQRRAKVYELPQEYGILEIKEKERTILEGTISYAIKEGISNEQARILQKKFQKRINKINKIPKVFKYSREQALVYNNSF